MVIDLDGLKNINDQYGHARGDELLRRFAQSLRRLENDGISSYRLGGDEFTLIAQKRHEAALKISIIRIETAFKRMAFQILGSVWELLTVRSTRNPPRSLVVPMRECINTKPPAKTLIHLWLVKGKNQLPFDSSCAVFERGFAA